jgi:hypothetical protein
MGFHISGGEHTGSYLTTQSDPENGPFQNEGKAWFDAKSMVVWRMRIVVPEKANMSFKFSAKVELSLTARDLLDILIGLARLITALTSLLLVADALL